MPGIVFHREPRGSSHIERGGRVPPGAELFARTIDGDTFAPARTPDWHVVAIDPPDGWHTSGGGTRYRFLTLER